MSSSTKGFLWIGGGVVALAVLLAGLNFFDVDISVGGEDATAQDETQTAQTTQSTTSTDTAQAPGSACPPTDVHVAENEVAQLNPGCIAAGDVLVSDNEAGPFEKKFDNDPNTGFILVCPGGCWLQAPYGANISPRAAEDYEQEMLQTGCDSDGCGDVVILTYNTAAPGQPSGPAKADPTAQVTDACDFSIRERESAQVPGGCIVAGDVRWSTSADGPWTALHDSDNRTGLIVHVSSSVWINAPYGASVHNADRYGDQLADMLEFGCGLSNGCDEVLEANIP